MVSITDSGVDQLKQAEETHLAGLQQRLFAHRSQAEIRTLARLTATILDANQT